MASLNSRQSVTVTSAEVASLLDIIRAGSSGEQGEITDRIDGQLSTIAQRENITKGGVLARVEDVDGLTLLHLAAQYGKSSVLDYYFRDGVFIFENGLRASQLNRKTKSLDGPIHMAARIGQTEFVKALVSRGASVDSKGAFGATALHFAAMEKNESLVKDLIGLGANLNTQTMSGQTALHIAAQKDDVATATLLLNNGANPNIRNAGDLKPGVIARGIANGRVYQLFLERGLPC
ncbi:hypothetical protein DL766_002962 [Monosporascus sp. MC13-8B]|uniref:Ankyrin repeat domain-containing protein n=1 Tax=Monosporascus cannonballus TaxID=155416 RepID=A0ABY0HIA6_9PEZI|nr:hypothetical protein DL763_010636 [Monosporascus cannonballus]RYO93723.1 hypothetical protein DL762_000928 [Monosporascus cannonballus]RYP34441.1 hypothetical protein DL766_002962 [Monosporascus sp. MC13-8B]